MILHKPAQAFYLEWSSIIAKHRSASFGHVPFASKKVDYETHKKYYFYELHEAIFIATMKGCRLEKQFRLMPDDKLNRITFTLYTNKYSVATAEHYYH